MPTPDFETAVKQEEAALRKQHPTAEDIPGCVKLFDHFLQCNVIASQLKSLYRYGQMAECSYKLEDFKYCMTNKGMHPEERYEKWIRRRAEWWATRRMTKSSEEVWEVRTEPIQNYPPPQSNVTTAPSFD